MNGLQGFKNSLIQSLIQNSKQRFPIQEAKPPNPRYQVEPGNEILEPLARVGCKL
ncbi:hypothetical protein NIES4073_83420 [Kalymmatonema gypsitolerans NIES-4073]|nr:hypothetical protein NIES4073_83420 [Scytonema sp. NIES-4073]